MKAVSEVIAIILILMITISLAGLAYTFMSSTMASTTSAASSAVTTTTSSILTSFTIESMDVAKVYVRNTGQTTLSSLSVYVNDVPAVYNITPSVITSGQVGTITIYSFIAEGDTIKIASPNGFSTSKNAPDPCSKAVGCWKLDEGTGTTAYDSSTYGNTGTLTNGPVWTTGKYGNGLLFDGVNDYVNAGNASSLNPTSEITATAWAKTNAGSTANDILFKRVAWNSNDGYRLLFSGGSNNPRVQLGLAAGWQDLTCPNTLQNNTWYNIGFTYNGSILILYLNGVQCNNKSVSGSIGTSTVNLSIGYSNFNGTIDEVRIYNRAIY